MLAISRYLVLAFQLCAITSTRVHAEPSAKPPYLLSVIANSRIDNVIPFACERVGKFPVPNWVLYRNGVAEDTTDPCIFPERYSDGVLTISSECDGHYSCGADYTNSDNRTGLVLSAPLVVYSIPELITILPQPVRACVGDTAFIPSYLPVSALADNVEVIWDRVETNMTADNGVVNDNYSFEVGNVTMSDAGQYVARVTVPNQAPVQGPTVSLTVGAKPAIDSVRLVHGLLSVMVTTSNEEFVFEWKFNGEIVAPVGDPGPAFSLPLSVTGNDQVEVIVSSECGATARAIVIVLTNQSSGLITGSTCEVATIAVLADSPLQPLKLAERDTMYSMLGVLATSLLFVTVIMLILALRMHRKRGNQKAKFEHSNGDLDLRWYSQSCTQSNPRNVLIPITNKLPQEANLRHTSNKGDCSCTEHSSLSEHSSRFHCARLGSPRTLPRYGYSANQSPPCSKPNAAHLTRPRQTISAIDEEVPDTTVQSLPTVDLESAEPSIPPTAHAADGTDSQTTCPQLASNPRQMHNDQSHPTPETSHPGISSEVALSIALYLKHKDCKNKGICYTCRAIEVQFTRLMKHCDPKIIGKRDLSSDIGRKLGLRHKVSLSSRTSTKPASKRHSNTMFKRRNSTASKSKYSLDLDRENTVSYTKQQSRPKPASHSVCSFGDYHSDNFSVDRCSSCHGQRRLSHQQQRMSHGVDCLHPSLDHYPRHHRLTAKRSSQDTVQKEQVPISVCRADVSVHDHRQHENDTEHPSSASPHHSHPLDSATSSAEAGQSVSSTAVLSPISQEETTPL